MWLPVWFVCGTYARGNHQYPYTHTHSHMYDVCTHAANFVDGPVIDGVLVFACMLKIDGDDEKDRPGINPSITWPV